MQHHFKIVVDAFGSGSVTMDGVDISKQVQGLVVRAGVGELTSVVIEFAPADVEIEAASDV